MFRTAPLVHGSGATCLREPFLSRGWRCSCGDFRAIFEWFSVEVILCAWTKIKKYNPTLPGKNRVSYASLHIPNGRKSVQLVGSWDNEYYDSSVRVPVYHRIFNSGMRNKQASDDEDRESEGEIKHRCFRYPPACGWQSPLSMTVQFNPNTNATANPDTSVNTGRWATLRTWSPMGKGHTWGLKEIPSIATPHSLSRNTFNVTLIFSQLSYPSRRYLTVVFRPCEI